MTSQRAPLISRFGRYPDPATSSEPQIRDLVAALATLERAPGPNADFRAELRTQLVAVSPDIIADAAATDQATASSGSVADRLREGARRVQELRVPRAVTVLTCAVTVVALVLGGALYLSRKALPGDALYGLKRATESLHEAVTGGPADKGKLLLAYAATRYDEVGDLIPKNGALGAGVQADSGGIDAGTAKLIESTLGSADNDIYKGMQKIGAQAVQDQSGDVMKVVIAWYQGPRTTLGAIVARISDPSLHDRAEQSLNLLDQAGARAKSIAALGQCACLSLDYADDLGPKPCYTCASPNAPNPSASSSTGPSGSTTVSPSGSAPVPGSSVGSTSDAPPGTVPSDTSSGAVPGGGDSSGNGGGSQPSNAPQPSEAPAPSGAPPSSDSGTEQPPSPDPTDSSSDEPPISGPSVPTLDDPSISPSPDSTDATTAADGMTAATCTPELTADGSTITACDPSPSPAQAP